MSKPLRTPPSIAEPIRFDPAEMRHRVVFEAFGVRVAVETNDVDAARGFRLALEAAVPGATFPEPAADAAHEFRFVWNRTEQDALYKDGAEIFRRYHRPESVASATSFLRLCVAEFAPRLAFIHAGVVSIDGRAVVIPGKSFTGKTALTAELVRRGALYYSDEFAILDESGLVHPFPKALSVRGEIDPHLQIEHPVADYGVAGTEPAPIGMFLFCEFREGALWRPAELTPAQGVIETLRNAVSVRRDPQFVISALARTNARFVKSKRGDLGDSADEIWNFVGESLRGEADQTR